VFLLVVVIGSSSSKNKCVAHFVRRVGTVKAAGKPHVCGVALQKLRRLVRSGEGDADVDGYGEGDERTGGLRQRSTQARATFMAARKILDLVTAEGPMEAEAATATTEVEDTAADEPEVKEPKVKSGLKAKAKGVTAKAGAGKKATAKRAPPGRHSTESMLFSSLGSFASGEFSEVELDGKSPRGAGSGKISRKSRLSSAAMTPEVADEAWLPTEEDQRTEEDEPPKLKLIEPSAALLPTMMQHLAATAVAAQYCGVKSLRGLIRAVPSEVPTIQAAGAMQRLQALAQVHRNKWLQLEAARTLIRLAGAAADKLEVIRQAGVVASLTRVLGASALQLRAQVGAPCLPCLPSTDVGGLESSRRMEPKRPSLQTALHSGQKERKKRQKF
jgi:hypothetical protein